MLNIDHVETNITTACNNVCVGCNHYIPMQRPVFVDPDQIRHDLAAFGKAAHIRRYALIGGEPTLHKRIDDILEIACASGVVDTVEVWTNGARIQAMSGAFWTMVDEIDLTVYPGKSVDISWIEAKCAETGTELRIKNGAADFTTLLYRRTANEAEAAEMYRTCWYRTYCRVLDNGYFYRCCTSPFIPKLILGLDDGADGLPVEGITEDALLAYLGSAETPASCARCAGNSGAHIGWRETSRAAWLDESMR